MNAQVQCDEASLRETLVLRMGSDPGELMLEAIAGGTQIEVKMTDGGLRFLESPQEAVDFLTANFGWSQQVNRAHREYRNPHVHGAYSEPR